MIRWLRIETMRVVVWDLSHNVWSGTSRDFGWRQRVTTRCAPGTSIADSLRFVEHHVVKKPNPPVRERQKAADADIVPLKDLAPRGDVKGGSGKVLFGQRIDALPGAKPFNDPKRTAKK